MEQNASPTAQQIAQAQAAAHGLLEWRATVAAEDRKKVILKLHQFYMQLSPNEPAIDLMKLASGFEGNAFVSSTAKDQYLSKCLAKIKHMQLEIATKQAGGLIQENAGGELANMAPQRTMQQLSQQQMLLQQAHAQQQAQRLMQQKAAQTNMQQQWQQLNQTQLAAASALQNAQGVANTNINANSVVMQGVPANLKFNSVPGPPPLASGSMSPQGSAGRMQFTQPQQQQQQVQNLNMQQSQMYGATAPYQQSGQQNQPQQQQYAVQPNRPLQQQTAVPFQAGVQPGAQNPTRLPTQQAASPIVRPPNIQSSPQTQQTPDMSWVYQLETILSEKQLTLARAAIQSLEQQLQTNRVRTNVFQPGTLSQAEEFEIDRLMQQLIPVMSHLDSVLPALLVFTSNQDLTRRLILMKFLYQDQMAVWPHKRYCISHANLSKLRDLIFRHVEATKSAAQTIRLKQQQQQQSQMFAGNIASSHAAIGENMKYNPIDLKLPVRKQQRPPAATQMPQPRPPVTQQQMQQQMQMQMQQQQNQQQLLPGQPQLPISGTIPPTWQQMQKQPVGVNYVHPNMQQPHQQVNATNKPPQVSGQPSSKPVLPEQLSEKTRAGPGADGGLTMNAPSAGSKLISAMPPPIARAKKRRAEADDPAARCIKLLRSMCNPVTSLEGKPAAAATTSSESKPSTSKVLHSNEKTYSFPFSSIFAPVLSSHHLGLALGWLPELSGKRDAKKNQLVENPTIRFDETAGFSLDEAKAR